MARSSTANGRGNLTFGGYSDHIVVDEAYVLSLPKGLDPAAAAPLLCAGITTYSPLKHWNVGPGMKVGGFLDYDTYWDFNADEFGQTLKAGLLFALDEKADGACRPTISFRSTTSRALPTSRTMWGSS